MTRYAELTLSDDTAVRVELAPAGPPPPGTPAHTPDPEPADLPGGAGPAVPVSRGTDAAAATARQALRTTLKPLGALLDEVNASLSTAQTPPEEVTVEFGVQVGQDLKLGLVGATGQANLRVTATWRPAAPHR
ncbi:CU044_2847 family protein [Streptomyces sp. HNM0574]|uniref:CU044_2847 family protein n=1 Tax=Streptomyces sp. HNM0574 TaxID=2714954 RepID=UPI00146DC4B0|nr:CU044_2847 family protein [Streptomyces sp. HNM0574]NLU68398.1 hypothetical protein [Streptomyces sp. HNM0574]